MVKKELKAIAKDKTEAEQRPGVHRYRVREIFDQYFFEDSITEKNAVQPQIPSQNYLISQKKIKKQRKAKKHNPDDRFLKEHQKRYYLFPFIYSTQNPFLKINWGQWKPNSVYKKMAAVLSSCPNIPGKTPVQCKSYDQRMKQEHFIKRQQSQKKDLFQSALGYLEKENMSANDWEIIQRYMLKMAEKSSYMQFLEQGIQMDEYEVKLQEQKLQVEVKREEANLTEESKENEILFNEFFDQF